MAFFVRRSRSSMTEISAVTGVVLPIDCGFAANSGV